MPVCSYFAFIWFPLSSFFQLALAARSKLHKQFGDKQPMNDHKNHFKKIHFLFTPMYKITTNICSTSALNNFRSGPLHP